MPSFTPIPSSLTSARGGGESDAALLVLLLVLLAVLGGRGLHLAVGASAAAGLGLAGAGGDRARFSGARIHVAGSVARPSRQCFDIAAGLLIECVQEVDRASGRRTTSPPPTAAAPSP
ncbi:MULTISPECIES: hypothetical protein [unclassified Streptomyces]|uniref:hypothetical protein n=1 Tax=unclassified Streptomyces TaxID=2593676 RepID=UPI0035DD1977